jgi:hypothetical protein
MTQSRTLLVAPTAILALVVAAAPSSAHTITSYNAGARSVPRSPIGPPLLGRGSSASAAADASASAPPSTGDPLVENGLGSPLCQRAVTSLSAVSQRNCETSGFEAAAAPTANYAFDVHIDTALFSLNFAVLVQDYVLSPVWMGLVWLAHAVVVALEWSYTLDLLDGSAKSALGTGLRETRATFTQPWLVLALALAAGLAAYHGLIRRRVAETLGQAMVMLMMMAAGLWVIMDPAGTVGALEGWSNQASLGTLGSVAQGRPGRGPRTLADSMRAVFSSVVGGPWCYLEFGDVGWCSDPRRLDPALHNAALRIAADEQTLADCHETHRLFTSCAQRGSKQAQALRASAMLLRQAHTNGELFLALPANQAARNSINNSSSLLRVLCNSDDPTACRGATAELAEFRTQSGTAARVEGLLLIVAGALGMVLLFGFLAMHLVGAALVGVFYLMLAPAAVVAPALGDGGRAAFRVWASHLLGSVVSKLVYSFLLGVMLLMTRILMGLVDLGWWTQWLLISALWWGIFRHRHQVLGFAHGQEHGRVHRHSLGSRIREVLDTPRELARVAGWTKARLSRPAPSVEPKRAITATTTPAVRRRARDAPDEQVGRVLAREQLDASAVNAAGPEIQARMAAEGRRLGRIREQRRWATAEGKSRQAARLGLRAAHVEEGIHLAQAKLDRARQRGTRGEAGQGLIGDIRMRERAERQARFLDAQAALPAAGERLRHTSAPGAADGAAGFNPRSRRNYVALAALAGYGPEEYERLDPRRRREARLTIDRELEMRRRPEGLRGAANAAVQHKITPRESSARERELARSAEQSLRADAHGVPPRDARPSSRPPRAGSPRGDLRSRESAVMRDAREVAQRRKRQLGR